MVDSADTEHMDPAVVAAEATVAHTCTLTPL